MALDPPTSLTASAVGMTAALAWENGGAYDEVHIYRKDGSGGSYILQATLAGGATVYTDQPPGNGDYYYRATGYTKKVIYTDPIDGRITIPPEESEPCNATPSPLTFATPTAPSTPTMGTLVATSSPLQVTIPCSGGGAGTLGYRIERAPNAGGSPGTYVEIGTANYTGGTVSYQDGTVTAATTCWYRIRAYNGYGNSSYATAAAATVPSVGSPGVPSIALVSIDGGFKCSITPGQNGTYPRAAFEIAWEVDAT